MKVSIITAVLNCSATIEHCIDSIAGQDYRTIEHIVIDGGSTDGTREVIERKSHLLSYFISEPDRGIYDAMNKGIRAATGDVIGILNADDFYADGKVIGSVVRAMIENTAESCYGDLITVKRKDVRKVIRYWKAGTYDQKKFRLGWMPPHPTFFAKTDLYKKYGLFNLAFPLAADYELMLRFLYKYGASTTYLPETLVHMRAGGASHPMSYTAKAIIENYAAWKVNDLRMNPFMFLLKPASKLLQFIHDKKESNSSMGNNQ